MEHGYGAEIDQGDDSTHPIHFGQQGIHQLPTRPPIIEITAPPAPTSIVNSPVLKTALCLYLVAIAVLAPRNEAVVYISTTAGSSSLAARLERQIVSLLKSKYNPPDGPLSAGDIETMTQEALANVHLFRPTSTAQVLVTLRRLPGYLGDMRRHVSGKRRLGLVILDTAHAFYWQDRMDDDVERIDPTAHSTRQSDVGMEEQEERGPDAAPSEAPPTEQDRPSPYINRKAMTSSIQSLLRSLQRDYSPAIVFTTSPNVPPKSSLWSLFPTLRLQVSSLAPSIAPFTSHMSISEALLDREKRKEVVQRGECVAVAIEGHEEDWRSDVRERFEVLGAEWLRLRFKLTKNVLIVDAESS